VLNCTGISPPLNKLLGMCKSQIIEIASRKKITELKITISFSNLENFIIMAFLSCIRVISEGNGIIGMFLDSPV
jgi:hypothetical protein